MHTHTLAVAINFEDRVATVVLRRDKDPRSVFVEHFRTWRAARRFADALVEAYGINAKPFTICGGKRNIQTRDGNPYHVIVKRSGTAHFNAETKTFTQEN
jgi:hypothetical protein